MSPAENRPLKNPGAVYAGLMAGDSVCLFFVGFEVVLKKEADALRALVAVADGVKAVTVAHDHLEIFVLRRKGQAGTGTRLPAAPLFKPGQVVQMRRGHLRPEMPAMRRIQRDVVGGVEMLEPRGRVPCDGGASR